MAKDVFKKIVDAEKESEELIKDANKKSKERIRRATEEAERQYEITLLKANEEKERILLHAENDAKSKFDNIIKKSEEDIYRIQNTNKDSLNQLLSKLVERIVNFNGNS